MPQLILVYETEVAAVNHASTMRQKGNKRKTGGSSGNFDEKCGHRVYGNASKKKPFVISQSLFTDNEFIARRQQMDWFEKAQMDLQYF